MTSTNIQVIEMQGVRALTTAQLAESYGTDTNTVKVNFNRHEHIDPADFVGGELRLKGEKV